MHAKISELKARLSSYLDAVRRGHSIVVLDRNTPIARVIPLRDASDGLALVKASAPPKDVDKIQGVRPRGRVDLDRILLETRGAR